MRSQLPDKAALASPRKTNVADVVETGVIPTDKASPVPRIHPLTLNVAVDVNAFVHEIVAVVQRP